MHLSGRSPDVGSMKFLGMKCNDTVPKSIQLGNACKFQNLMITSNKNELNGFVCVVSSRCCVFRKHLEGTAFPYRWFGKSRVIHRIGSQCLLLVLPEGYDYVKLSRLTG